MEPIPLTRIIAAPDLDECPIGLLFRGKNPDWANEARYFPGLEAPLNHHHWSPETHLLLIEGEEGHALENISKVEALIITQDRHLADLRVEARVRQFIPGALPNMDSGRVRRCARRIDPPVAGRAVRLHPGRALCRVAHLRPAAPRAGHVPGHLFRGLERESITRSPPGQGF